MYIEFVIADNFLLTYLAGATATRLCHKRVNKWRTLLAAALGTTVAVFYPFMRVGAAAAIAIRAGLGAALCAIMFIRTRRPITSSLMFLGSTFAYGGACYAIGYAVYGSSAMATEFCGRHPLFLVPGAGAAVYVCARYVTGRLRVARARAPYEYGVRVEVYGATLTFTALLDTGNCVFDSATGLPAVIADTDRFMSGLKGAAAIKAMRELSRTRRITVHTPAGEAGAYIIRPTSVTVYTDRQEHKIDVVIALVGGWARTYDMLLNPAALGPEVP